MSRRITVALGIALQHQNHLLAGPDRRALAPAGPHGAALFVRVVELDGAMQQFGARRPVWQRAAQLERVMPPSSGITVPVR